MDGMAALIAQLKARSSVTSEQTSDACPICGGSGYILRRDEKGELFSRECKCEVIRQNQRRIERSGLKPLLENCTFDRYKALDQWQKSVKETAEKYVDDHDGKWFFIGGSSGTGKTHLCTAICGELMGKGVPVRYVQWRSDIPPIKAKINDADAYQDAIWPLKTVKALYIDDFLKGSVSEGDKNIAFDLLNARYNNPDAITLISSELTIDKILEWDEAIGSRIAERSKGYTLNLRGKQNWRLR